MVILFLMSGTRMSGWVLRQKERMDMQMKKTEITPITCNISIQETQHNSWTANLLRKKRKICFSFYLYVKLKKKIIITIYFV